MANISDVFEKIIVNGHEINLQALVLVNGSWNVGSQQDVTVEYVFKDKTQIPSNIFGNLSQLKSAYFPSSIKTIGNQAFANSNLSYIDNLSYVNYIGSQAFSYTKLSYVYGANKPGSIASDAWSYINTLDQDFKNELSYKYPYIDFGVPTEDPNGGESSYGGQSPSSINVVINSINVSNLGGIYDIDYTISNPDGNTIFASADVDWIINFDYTTSGKVSFYVNPQESGAAQRSGNITLSYGNSYITITIIQDADSNSGTTPGYDPNWMNYNVGAQYRMPLVYTTRSGDSYVQRIGDIRFEIVEIDSNEEESSQYRIKINVKELDITNPLTDRTIQYNDELLNRNFWIQSSCLIGDVEMFKTLPDWVDGVSGIDSFLAMKSSDDTYYSELENNTGVTDYAIRKMDNDMNQYLLASI